MKAPTSNAALLERSLRAVWHPCSQMKQHVDGQFPLIPIARGQGAWLYDFDGNRYLDGISSWWVNLFGHANPTINAALKTQLESLAHVIIAGFTHEPVVELSERLSALTHGSLGHCFFASDGASATEIALKMSFHSWQNRGKRNKTNFLCLEGSYHGETVGALAVTDVAIFKDAYAPLVRAAATVPSPDARKAKNGETSLDVARQAAQALERHLAQHHATIAALIVEPLIQCASGMVMYDPEYLRLARKLCDHYEVHLICDEIAVGCGRTGTFFAHEQASIRPDFLCLSKGISGGYLPLSIVLTTDKVYASFYDDATVRGFLHSHSYTGNALACRAALATLDIFEHEHVIEKNLNTAAKLGAVFSDITQHPKTVHLRQKGMIAAFDVITDDPAFARRFYKTSLEHQLLTRPIGNTVYVMPPYIINDEEIAHIHAALKATLHATVDA